MSAYATPVTSGGHTIARAALLARRGSGARGRSPIRLVLALCRHALIAACAAAAAATSAETVPWLYDAQVPVASQTAAERERATRRALTEVLVRVTGATEVPMDGAVAAALAAPSRYVLRFQFTRAPQAATAQGQPAPNGNSTLFDVRFDAHAVLALLRDAQLPIWGANRPVVLVWLAVRGGGRDELVAADANDAWAAALQRQARRRGIATVLPVMDLQDRHLSTSAVWGFFWEDIEAASRRYRPAMLLVGRAALGQSGWWTKWELRAPEAAAFDAAGFDAAFDPGGQASVVPDQRLDTRYEHGPAAPEASAQAAIDHVADTLAARFAVRGGAAQAFQATVHGAQTVRGYARLLDHLDTQEYIERVDVLAATPRALEIRLHTRSDLRQLAELLAQSNRLAVRPAGERMDITWRGPK